MDKPETITPMPSKPYRQSLDLIPSQSMALRAFNIACAGVRGEYARGVAGLWMIRMAALRRFVANGNSVGCLASALFELRPHWNNGGGDNLATVQGYFERLQSDNLGEDTGNMFISMSTERFLREMGSDKKSNSKGGLYGLHL